MPWSVHRSAEYLDTETFNLPQALCGHGVTVVLRARQATSRVNHRSTNVTNSRYRSRR
jgi:hypothetical protein